MENDSDQPIPWRRRLTFRLTGGVILALLLIGIPFLFAFHTLLRKQQLDSLSEATSALSRVVVDGLRSAMLAGQPHLLDQTLRHLSAQEEVERVILIDHQGRVRVASDRSYEGRTLNREQDSTCRVCHQVAGGTATSRTAVTRVESRRVFRAMSIIPNEPACHGCHDPAVRSNGILLMDVALGAADRRFFTGIGSTIALGTVMVLFTIAVLVLLLRSMVHHPLGAIVSASRAIVLGDLDARAEVSSGDEFSLLATHVNRMTDHLARSLRKAEGHRRELQAILDAVDDEIVVLDREQRVVASNQAFQRGIEPHEGEVVGRFCRDVTSHKWPCAADLTEGCPVQRVFLTGQLHKGIVSCSGPDGVERSIEIHASPLRDAAGAVSHAVEVRRDISERRQLEGTLAHSERLASLGLLASGLSHEINNPLGAIATSVEGLRRRLPGDPGLTSDARRSLEEVLRRIAGEVDRGRTITHRLLKVARPPGTVRSLFDVNQIVHDIIAILAHDMKRSRIVASLQLGDSLPTVSGDESSLGQVVMNLAINSIQAMTGNGGTLRIATAVVDGMIQIEVEDSGSGISPGLLKRIYEPFFTTKPVGSGTGLGLFITHRIVTEMGGDIQVRSQPGRGTVFTVRVPRTRARREA